MYSLYKKAFRILTKILLPYKTVFSFCLFFWNLTDENSKILCRNDFQTGGFQCVMGNMSCSPRKPDTPTFKNTHL